MLTDEEIAKIGEDNGYIDGKRHMTIEGMNEIRQQYICDLIKAIRSERQKLKDEQKNAVYCVEHRAIKCSELMKERKILERKNARITFMESQIYDLNELIKRIETSDDLCYEQVPLPKRVVLELSEWCSICNSVNALKHI